jgi:hypothetical protein
MYLPLEINGTPYMGKTYQAPKGILIYLPGLQASDAAPTLDLLQVIPEVNVFAYEIALRILEDAEDAFGAKSMAQERAANGNWPQPANIADFLFWIEDEATIQEDRLRTQTRGARIRRPYAEALRGVAQELRELGFRPATPPWDEPQTPAPVQPLVLSGC